MYVFVYEFDDTGARLVGGIRGRKGGGRGEVWKKIVI